MMRRLCIKLIDKPMINFIEGKIHRDETNTLSVSSYEDLNTLAAKGNIEKREYPKGIYYYVEYKEDSIRFGIFIALKDRKIDCIVLRWLDGPCTSKGWDNVNEKALKDEYRFLLNFVEQKTGRPPESTRDRQRTWRFTWGQVNVSYESREFVTQIYMQPR